LIAGVEGTVFATLMSIFNGGSTVGSELGALLTSMFGVSDTDFRNLGPLLVACNLSSLVSLPFLSLLPRGDRSISTDEEPETTSHINE